MEYLILFLYEFRKSQQFQGLYYTTIEEIMESSIRSLLKSPPPKETQQPLLESEFRNQQTQESYNVKAYPTMIVIGNQYLSYSFDLRFSVRQKEITFSLDEDAITYDLPRGDHLVWRDTLKLFLNQKGFHEQFKPIKKIGKGNFASVYLVEKLENNLKYAVKAFSKEAAYSEQNGKECLIKQIQIMRHLSTPNNMRLYEVFQSENSLYIIFELLEGGQLYEKIKSKQKFKPKQVKKMIKGILEGLREMHSKNIMHRDLKPENILFKNESDYDCIIADFGLAEFADAPEYLFVRCGTPGYVAPEVINIKDMKTKYSPICDMFSLGLIFHLLVCGTSVFKGKTYNEVLSENRACDFDLNGPFYKDIDPEVMDLMKKMLRVNPEERITAEQAICHPYFRSHEDSDDEDANDIKEELKDSMQNGLGKGLVDESPLLTTKNQKRKENKAIKKDSCVDFKMAKDNVISGKTETVADTGSSKVSVFGLNLLKGVKMSKFVRPVQADSQEKEND